MLRGKRILAVLVALVTIGALVAGCAKAPQAPAKQEAPAEIKVGVLAPLTGDAATFGESTANGAKMAAEEWNAKGGINGKQIKLIVEDTKLDPTEGVNAANKLVTQDQVVGLIGAVASKVSLPIAESVAQPNKVVQISSASTNDRLGKIGDYIFRACFKDSFQGLVMAKFAVDTLKAKSAAVLYDIGNDYTKGLAESFKANFEKLGGKVLAFESYGKDDVDFSAQLTIVKGKKPDVLFLPDYYNKVGVIAKQAKAKGITAKLLGGDGWDSPDLTKIGGDAVEGGYFSNHYSKDNKTPVAVTFLDNYNKKFNKEPDALAALAYDAANILFTAIEQAKSTDRAAIRDAMAKTKDFKGVTGVITFDENGDPVKSAVVLTIEKGQQKFVQAVNP